MLNLNALAIAAALLIPFVAEAAPSPNTAKEIAYIRTFLPLGQDVAQYQAFLLRGGTEDEALEVAQSNYLLRDLTGDGIDDLLVISEPMPQLINYNTNQPCKSQGEPECIIVYGTREFRFYVGGAQGGFDLNILNNHMVLGGDEGGVFGDPLNGFSVRKSGAIALSVYGGSAWRWGYTDVMQFRDGDLKLIGQDSYDGWNGDGRSHTVSKNLITGEVIEKTAKDAESKEIVKRYRIKRKPLINIRDYNGTGPN